MNERLDKFSISALAIALSVILGFLFFGDQSMKAPPPGHQDRTAFLRDFASNLESANAGTLNLDGPGTDATALDYAEDICSAYIFGNYEARINSLIDSDPIYYQAAGPATYHVCSEYWSHYEEMFDR